MADSEQAGANPILDVLRLGTTRYEDAYEIQQGLLAKRIAGEVRDTLVLTEHEPVVTVGRGTSKEAVAAVQVPVFEIERGGEATFHGPGQVVVYPILELTDARKDLHRYMRDLEEVVIRLLSEFEVDGERRAGLTGVWVGEHKIASIGVAVRRWVTWHGLALNVHTDLAGFQSFNPCGLQSDVMTRLADLAEIGPGNLLVEVLIVKHFCDVFGYDLPPPASTSATDGPSTGFPELPVLG